MILRTVDAPGTGIGNPTDPALGSNVPFNVQAIFAPASCTLFGSALTSDGNIWDVFVWTVYKDSLSGPFTVSIGGEPLFTGLGRNHLVPA